MAIYLGDSGYVEIRREGLNSSMGSLLDPGDVNVLRRRFSFDFDTGALVTGDRLQIRTTDGSTLELVDGHVYPDGTWYVNVDQAGGIRLYTTFAAAINGEEADALPLVAPSRNIPIVAVSRDVSYRCLAQIQDYQLTTSRETIDLTSLGDEFRTNYANGLISGQGVLNCLWDYEATTCSDVDSPTRQERPHYLAQLVIRTQQGAGFLGRFLLKADGRTAISGGNASAAKDELWWEARCIITNVAFTFSPSTPISSSVEFVTTGQVRLRMGSLPGYLLQESGSYLLQESGEGLELEHG